MIVPRRFALALSFALAALCAAPAALHAQDGGPTSPSNVPELWTRIASTDSPEIRDAALGETMQMLESDDFAVRERGMEALAETTAIPFDRAPFLPMVRKAMDDPHPGVRALALRTIAPFGGTVDEDMAAVVARAKDEERHVRGWVAFAMYKLDPKGAHPDVEPTVLALLADPEPVVLSSTLQWPGAFGNPPGVPRHGAGRDAVVDRDGHRPRSAPQRRVGPGRHWRREGGGGAEEARSGRP
jgi:hypothetical protein